MKRAFLLPITAGALAVGLTACSSTEAPAAKASAYLADARLGEQVDKICFHHSVDNFRDMTEQTVIVEKGVKDYLVETDGKCNQLARARQISFDTYMASACISTKDHISASTSTFRADNTAPSSFCRIKAIYEWNEDAPQVASVY